MRSLPFSKKLVLSSLTLAAALVSAAPVSRARMAVASADPHETSLGHRICSIEADGTGLSGEAINDSDVIPPVQGRSRGSRFSNAQRISALSPCLLRWDGALLTQASAFGLSGSRIADASPRSSADAPAALAASVTATEDTARDGPIADLPPVLSTTFLLLASLLVCWLISEPRRRKRVENRGRRTASSYKYLDDSVHPGDVVRAIADSITPRVLARRGTRKRRASRVSRRTAERATLGDVARAIGEMIRPGRRRKKRRRSARAQATPNRHAGRT